MSFNRRGPDRRPDRPDRDRFDRPPRREGGGDRPYQQRGGGDRPYQQRGGGDRPYQQRGGGDRSHAPRDRPPHREGGGDRPYQQRGGGDRPFSPRPRFDRPPDEGAMSIRLDPRRVNALKHLAGEAGVRPGDLVRQWVEERIDRARVGADGTTLDQRIAVLEQRITALESGTGAAAESEATSEKATKSAPEGPGPVDAGVAAGETGTPAVPEGKPRKRASAAPSERVALHDEMIALIGERGPMTAAELAQAITERGRYAPPRSGKPLDAAMVSQRVSNPTYRSRFVRDEGRIGLAE